MNKNALRPLASLALLGALVTAPGHAAACESIEAARERVDANHAAWNRARSQRDSQRLEPRATGERLREATRDYEARVQALEETRSRQQAAYETRVNGVKTRNLELNRRIESSRDKLQKERRKLQSDIARLKALWKKMLRELRAGMYCSRCHHTASEIQRTGESFAAHLKRVNGRPVPAPPELENEKKAEMQRKLDAAERKLAALDRNMENEEQRYRAELGRLGNEFVNLRNQRQQELAGLERERQEIDASQARTLESLREEERRANAQRAQAEQQVAQAHQQWSSSMDQWAATKVCHEFAPRFAVFEQRFEQSQQAWQDHQARSEQSRGQSAWRWRGVIDGDMARGVEQQGEARQLAFERRRSDWGTEAERVRTTPSAVSAADGPDAIATPEPIVAGTRLPGEAPEQTHTGPERSLVEIGRELVEVARTSMGDTIRDYVSDLPENVLDEIQSEDDTDVWSATQQQFTPEGFVDNVSSNLVTDVVDRAADWLAVAIEERRLGRPLSPTEEWDAKFEPGAWRTLIPAYREKALDMLCELFDIEREDRENAFAE